MALLQIQDVLFLGFMLCFLLGLRNVCSSRVFVLKPHFSVEASVH